MHAEGEFAGDSAATWGGGLGGFLGFVAGPTAPLKVGGAISRGITGAPRLARLAKTSKLMTGTTKVDDLTKWSKKGVLPKKVTLTDEAIDRGLLNNKKVQWKIRSKEDQYLARELLLSISTKRGNANFSERDILDITKELKTKYPIEVYNENLDEIFLSHNYQTDW